MPRVTSLEQINSENGVAPDESVVIKIGDMALYTKDGQTTVHSDDSLPKILGLEQPTGDPTSRKARKGILGWFSRWVTT